MTDLTRRELLWLGAGAMLGPRADGQELSAPPAIAVPRPRKKLIAWGWDTAYPEKIQANIRKIEELPWDGIVLSHFKARQGGSEVMFEWNGFGRRKFEREQLADTIEVLKHISFQKFTDNFLRFNVQPGDVDWFDDFSPVLHNARLWADVARETGMKGWKFDVEDYSDRVFTYGKQKYASSRSFDDYVRQVQLRGRQLIEAVQDRFPEIVILLSLAHSYVNRTLRADGKLSDLPSYALLPAFVNGMIEGAGAKGKLVDGQEQAYGYLTAEDFFRGYHSVRQDSLQLVPRSLHEKYRQRLDAGVALWANLQLAVPVTTSEGWVPHYMTPAERLRLFEQNVYYALKTTDEYVWLYSEQMSWWEAGFPSPTPEGATDAIRRARGRIEANQPLDFDMSSEVAAARTRMAKALQGK